MRFKHSSLRTKIKLSFLVVLLFVLSISSIIFFNLLVIEERVGFYAVISQFLDITLEIRRFEKNYFLYRKKGDYYETAAYVKAAEELVEKNLRKFDAFSSLQIWWTYLFHRERIPTMISERVSGRALAFLNEYKTLLRQDFAAGTNDVQLEQKIRRNGHRLTEIAEALAEQEGKKIQQLLSSTQSSLLVAMVLLFFGTIFIAGLVSRIAIRPLEELEISMRKIASGNLGMLTVRSRHAEIVSLVRAFNRMIRELFKHRDIIRSEKLASLGTMFAGIAHEINNPLSNISTSAQILAEECKKQDSAFHRELVSQIVQETDRARTIVKGVLDFSKDRDFKKKDVSLLETIRETLHFIRGDMPAHITLMVDIPHELTIFADKGKIEQAFLNILKNSIDAMPYRDQEDRLTVSAKRKDGGQVEVSISDTGMGIPKDRLNRIFDPFFTTKDVGRGTGLGLFVTHEIIEEHGGALELKSMEGMGTTFLIRLPSKGDVDGRQGKTPDRR